MTEGTYWYCLDHKKVEPYAGCRSDSRLGPYATPAEAADALQKVAARNEAWDNDPLWNDDEDDEEDERPYGPVG